MTPEVKFPSIPAALEQRAAEWPDAAAFTFIDYEVDPAGFAETLTWSELRHRVRVVAAEIAGHGSVGDRAAILAPQSMEYLVGFLAAMEAGFIVVPLSVPMFGAQHDERVSAALRDCAPAVILTTTSVIEDVLPYAQDIPGTPPALIELDVLDFMTSAPQPPGAGSRATTAVLQYTSGSTSQPRGVVVSHTNVVLNLHQLITDMFAHHGGWPAPDTTLVSWLPFYHDMGLLLGICGGVYAGRHTVVMSPMAFLQKPSRWIQTMARYSTPFTSAPNFAYALAARRTSDDDMAGLDLGHVTAFMCGAERVHASTLRRFTDRFAAFNLPDNVVRPAYGLAEATLYVAALTPGQPAVGVRFDYEKLAAGYARRCSGGMGSELMSHGPQRSVDFRIVDPQTREETAAGTIGEIWVHGEQVPSGYWRNPQQTEAVFGARLIDPIPGTPDGPWLRTGDLGVISEGDLFITGRIKDLLIVDGRNLYPDDIEGTVGEVTRGRVAAISVPDNATESLVTVAEVKNRAGVEELGAIKAQVMSTISQIHKVRVADVVLVAPGSIPVTTSGKTRRSTSAEYYLAGRFDRLDGSR